MAGVAVYGGSFGAAQAERLLWRAGFGPRRGEAEELAAKGLQGAISALTNPGAERLVGLPPTDGHGHPLAPYDAWGQDHVWWLDRMVRTSRPLVERMTLVWHDWFATSNEGVGSQRLMLNQNQLFRANALGNFQQLLVSVTKDPAMLLWLNGTENRKDAPNENYGREMMELFTLGADRGAYTEDDVRQQARSLTGWTNRWSNRRGDFDFHFDPDAHDEGTKTVFGKRGTFSWEDACNACATHPLHASFFVKKLWSYFVPTPPDAPTLAGLEELYADRDVKPVVAAILAHPDLYEGQRMMKPPIVHTAGLLRRLGARVDTTDWAWIGQLAGQQLFYPPNVGGWDDTRWLDTATFRGRWYGVNRMLEQHALDPDHPPKSEPADANAILDRALAFWNNPTLAGSTRRVLLAFANGSLRSAKESWEQASDRVQVENALRQLVAMSPDLQTS
ncbi:MAG TPA: DUF1800 domain-containing protein [Gaiellaceae bacterium]